MEEEWRPIPGWEGLYEVSNLGRVKSCPREVQGRPGRKPYKRPGQLRKPSVNSTGRLQVGLSAPGRKWFNMKVHRAVALAFLGPAPEGCEVCHNDGNPMNNRLDNLRWGTKKENSADAVRMRRFPAQQRTHCPRGHPLSPPNLTAESIRKGWRSCLACSRAHAESRNRGVEMTRNLADDHYGKIIGEVGHGEELCTD